MGSTKLGIFLVLLIF
uniref:Uncharacterized protein LOC104236543 n=1 Tax=Nicotiana sylvestris TaxID=4096 RepID=A0A1U7XD37_NICSY|nr:PREDICTED: uncharacterized protein LOC104236543 [Nicotiana sylvestris]